MIILFLIRHQRGHTLVDASIQALLGIHLADESNFHGASCLGQLSGLGDKKKCMPMRLKTLSDKKSMTTFNLVSDLKALLDEAARASKELSDIGKIIRNQLLIRFEK